jgi:hypothetical protein
MRIVHFDREQAIPVVDVKVYGPLRSTKARLVFDTGSQFTMVDTEIIDQIGYSVRDGIKAAPVASARLATSCSCTTCCSGRFSHSSL